MAVTNLDYRKNSLSLIATVLDEENSILDLLNSYKNQSFLASEFIIVDAGSKDQTIRIIKDFSEKNKNLAIKLFEEKGNRSHGRNLAIKKAKGDLIAITDAGCILDCDWLKNLFSTAKKEKAAVVAGFYHGLANTRLEEAFLPYFLVMPNQLRGEFLPATRSMLISKNLLEKVGAFDESLEVSEDFQLAKKIKEKEVKIAFAKEALVYWQAPANWQEFWQKTRSFAFGDIRANVFRKKVLLIFLRYLLALFLLFNNWQLLLILVFVYSFWAIAKNFKNCKKSFFFLPLVQIVSDLAVMTGTLAAFFALVFGRKLRK
jgi:glycosyltransferase involved in cell wall biosynthesis